MRSELYKDAVQAYTETRRVTPDREWKAMLLLVTALPSLWEKARPYLQFKGGNAFLGEMTPEVYLSGGEALVLEPARNLFNGGAQVDMAAPAVYREN